MAALRPRRARGGTAALAHTPRAAAPAGEADAAAAPAASSEPAPLVPLALPAALPLRRRKVLYEKQAVEDDHTDEHFLEELVLNLDVRPRSYWVVVRGSVGVTQQLSVTVGAALVFFFVNEGALSPDALLCLDGARSAACARACVPSAQC
jgi:hypothetical protein